MTTTRGALVRKPLALLSLALGIILVGCSPSPDDIFEPASMAAKGDMTGVAEHRILMMTTRAPDADPTVLYSTQRADTLQFAAVTVTVPPIHETGKLERPTRLPEDPQKKFTLQDATIYGKDTLFLSALKAELAKRPPADREVLVFVHGYNTSLPEAALRLGQFVHDSGYRGVPVLFSWASRGRTLDYVYDLNSALAARDDLLRGAYLMTRSGAKSFDVLAHSMGNLLTVEALRQSKLEGTFGRAGLLRYVILASPDIDADLFARQLSVFPKDQRRFYVLISKDDKALGVSRLIAGGVPRVGNDDVAALADLGVTVIDLTKIEGSGAQHAKFTESPEIVQIIGERLAVDGSLEAPQNRRILEQALTLPITVVNAMGEPLN